MKRITLLALVLLFLSACSWWGNEDDDYLTNPYKGKSAKILYTEAKASLKSEQYSSAARRLEALESMYPFSRYTESAQLLLIYCYYKDEAYKASAAKADSYIHLYPRSKNVDYAYYMKGLANFSQPRTALGRFFPMNASWRDPGTQTQAYTDFSTFTEKFPHSRYYNDALMRLIYLRNQFAQRELNNANYYFNRHMYVAAVERANYLVKNYPQAPAVHGALIVLYRSYTILELYKAADEAAKVYEATYHKPIPKRYMEKRKI